MNRSKVISARAKQQPLHILDALHVDRSMIVLARAEVARECYAHGQTTESQETVFTDVRAKNGCHGAPWCGSAR